MPACGVPPGDPRTFGNSLPVSCQLREAPAAFGEIVPRSQDRGPRLRPVGLVNRTVPAHNGAIRADLWHPG
jgi:hypothetical protein